MANSIFRDAYKRIRPDSSLGKELRRVGQTTLYSRRFYLNDTELRVFYRRKLKIENASGVSIQIKMKYRTKAKDGKWYWYNPTPGNSTYVFRHGRSSYLKHNGFTINASRVRVYATAPGFNYVWNTYNARDLWIAPREGYLAKQMSSSTYRLTR